MTMQNALHIAADENCFARPTTHQHYSYRYEQHGPARFLHVHGRDKYGEFRSDFWRTLTQREIEADWILCDQEGNPFTPHTPPGLTLAQLAA